MPQNIQEISRLISSHPQLNWNCNRTTARKQ
nr:MAG TPA: hypothetical protein [Crassvirales sp.]